MKRQWMVLILIGVATLHFGCASSSSSKKQDSAGAFDEEIADSESEFSEGGDSEDDFGDDGFGDDFGDGSEGDDFAEEDSGGGELDDELSEDFSEEGDDFAEDDFSEGDDFAEDDFAEDDFGEDDFAEDEFADEPSGDDSQNADADFDDFEEFDESEGELDTASNDFQEPAAETPTPAEPVTPAPVVMAPAQNLANITNIEFSAANSGQIIISSDQPVQFQSRRNEELGQFIIDMENVALPASLQRPFNTRDMEGSVGAIDAYQDPGSSSARVVVQMRGTEYPSVQQVGNQLVLTPPSPLMAETPIAESVPTPVVDPSQALKGISLEEYLAGNTRFYGKPISIEFNNADVREIFKMIAAQSGANLVISDQVNGNLTVKLRSVPWDQALVVIMKAKRLGYTRQGNVIRIAPLEALKAETDEAKKIQDTRKQIEALKVKVIPVSFAKVSELAGQVKEFLSPRGKVVGDIRTSSVVVTDVQDSIDAVSQLISNLDVPPPQVLIEAKIVEAREVFSKSLGINWDLGGESISLSGGSNPIEIRPNLDISPLGQVPGGGMIFNVDIGTINVLGDINTVFALAEQQSLVKVISSPRILTLHNEPAEITQTSEIPLVNSVNDNGVVTTSVSFKPVRLSLSVTPQITSSESVIMGVEVVREFLGAALNVGDQNRPVNSRTAKTRIMVQDGQTSVIGGIYQSDVTNGQRGVPGLKDLPFIGGLFRSRSEEKTRTELLIFITPRIASRNKVTNKTY